MRQSPWKKLQQLIDMALRQRYVPSTGVKKIPNNSFGRGPSHTTEEFEGTRFIEEDVLEPMEMHSMVNDYPLPSSEPTSEVNYNLYEENCPYRREELIKFRLVEVFSEYDEHSVCRRDDNKFVWLIYLQWLSIYGRLFRRPFIC